MRNRLIPAYFEEYSLADRGPGDSGVAQRALGADRGSVRRNEHPFLECQNVHPVNRYDTETGIAIHS